MENVQKTHFCMRWRKTEDGWKRSRPRAPFLFTALFLQGRRRPCRPRTYLWRPYGYLFFLFFQKISKNLLGKLPLWRLWRLWRLKTIFMGEKIQKNTGDFTPVFLQQHSIDSNGDLQSPQSPQTTRQASLIIYHIGSIFLLKILLSRIKISNFISNDFEEGQQGRKLIKIVSPHQVFLQRE